MEEFIMSSKNRVEVPEAKAAMDKFKFEVARFRSGALLNRRYTPVLMALQALMLPQI